MRTNFEFGNKPTLKKIAEEIVRRNGITINWKNTRMERPAPEERFIVGIGKFYERKYRVGSTPGWLRIADCITDYSGDVLLDRDVQGAGLWLGAWLDSGILYLDICRTYTDRFDAERAAKRAGEIAYYDAEADEAIEVDLTRI
jgi:hypothetical protein